MPTLHITLPVVFLLGLISLGRGPDFPGSGGKDPEEVDGLETVRVMSEMDGKVRLKDETGKVYVQEGDSIMPGQVLCMIKGEPISVEIRADRKGKLTRIHVREGKKVRYDDLLFSVQSQPRSQKELFLSVLAEGGMEYMAPEGFLTTEVRSNPDMAYQWAIRLPAKRLEVRYSIVPLKDMVKEYNATKKDPERIMIDPNQMYNSLSMANVMNTSIGDAQPMQLFPSDAVRDEFNADWGGTTVYTPRNSFANYKKCLIIALHRENTADAFICYLFDDYDNIEVEFINAFHSLRFK